MVAGYGYDVAAYRCDVAADACEAGSIAPPWLGCCCATAQAVVWVAPGVRPGAEVLARGRRIRRRGSRHGRLHQAIPITPAPIGTWTPGSVDRIRPAWHVVGVVGGGGEAARRGLTGHSAASAAQAVADAPDVGDPTAVAAACQLAPQARGVAVECARRARDVEAPHVAQQLGL